MMMMTNCRTIGDESDLGTNAVVEKVVDETSPTFAAVASWRPTVNPISWNVLDILTTRNSLNICLKIDEMQITIFFESKVEI